MIRYKNLTLIGTSHISPDSIAEVQAIIYEKRPIIVALELDQRRFISLFSKKKSGSWKSIRAFGLSAFILGKVGAWIEERLGKLVGVHPGDDMRTAVHSAKNVGATIALIDQDITITLKRLAMIPWKERLRVVVDIFNGMFHKPKGLKHIDLRKVPSQELIEHLLSYTSKRYPSLYFFLVEERNRIMAQHLGCLLQDHPTENIVAVVGAGHEKGIIQHLEKILSSA